MAELRDRYVSFPGMHERFSQLYDVWRNLLEVEQALFEFLEKRKPLLGEKAEREVYMIGKAAVENAKILLVIATNEHHLLSERANAQD